MSRNIGAELGLGSQAGLTGVRNREKGVRIDIDVSVTDVEMTKKFESVQRGFLRDLLAEIEGVSIRGEVTLGVAGNRPALTRS